MYYLINLYRNLDPRLFEWLLIETGTSVVIMKMAINYKTDISILLHLKIVHIFELLYSHDNSIVITN